SGQLIAVGSGIYAHPSIDPWTASVIAVANYYPKAVISNRTALVIHALSDERIDRVDVDIPRTTSIRNSILSVHRVSEDQIIGVCRHDFQGRKIRIYSRERALCDAYRIYPE